MTKIKPQLEKKACRSRDLCVSELIREKLELCVGELTKETATRRGASVLVKLANKRDDIIMHVAVGRPGRRLVTGYCEDGAGDSAVVTV